MEILIVEDDESTRMVLDETLRMLGYYPHAVSTCMEGSAVLKVRPIRAAVLDYWLGGSEHCGPLAKSLHDRRIPFLLITAWNDAQGLADTIHATACLKKPFDIEDLDAEIRRLIVIPAAPESRCY